MNPEAAYGAPDSSLVSSKRIQDEPRFNPKEMFFYIKARVDCGAQIEIMQRQRGLPWEFIVTPKAGTQVSDFARIVDGQIRINMIEESALGMYQLLDLLIHPMRKRKKFLGIF